MRATGGRDARALCSRCTDISRLQWVPDPNLQAPLPGSVMSCGGFLGSPASAEWPSWKYITKADRNPIIGTAVLQFGFWRLLLVELGVVAIVVIMPGPSTWGLRRRRGVSISLGKERTPTPHGVEIYSGGRLLPNSKSRAKKGKVKHPKLQGRMSPRKSGRNQVSGPDHSSPRACHFGHLGQFIEVSEASRDPRQSCEERDNVTIGGVSQPIHWGATRVSISW